MKNKFIVFGLMILITLPLIAKTDIKVEPVQQKKMHMYIGENDDLYLSDGSGKRVNITKLYKVMQEIHKWMLDQRSQGSKNRQNQAPEAPGSNKNKNPYHVIDFK